MQQDQSNELHNFTSPVTHPFDIPFEAGADDLAPSLHTAASIDGSRGRMAAMKAVLDKGSALVDRERRHTKNLQDLLEKLTQITDRENILSDKTKSLQEKTIKTSKDFMAVLAFHPKSNHTKGDHIRACCARLANTIDQSVAEYLNLNMSNQTNLETTIHHGTQRYNAHRNLYFTLIVHMAELKKTSDKYTGTSMPAKAIRPAMSLYPDQWTMGSSRDAESQRGDRARRPRIPASPYQHLPVTQRAMAPHTGIDWWETNSDDRDILKHRELMEQDPNNLSEVEDETFRKYGKKRRDVRIMAYGWDTSFTSSDVEEAIYKMNLPLMQQLVPSTGKDIPSVDIRLHYLDVFTWWLLKTRSGHIDGITMSFRMAVGEGDGAQPLHAWCNITNAARKTFDPSDFPYVVEEHVKRHTGIDIVINTMNLKNNWLEATCITGRLDCAVQKPAHWNTLQAQGYEHKYLQIQNLTGKGSICAVSAAEGNLRFIDKPGPFRLDVVNVAKRTRPEDIMRLFTKYDITWKGYSIRGTGARHTITMGFEQLPQQIAGAKLLALRAHSGINNGMPLRVDVSYDYPINQCRKCYNPNNTAGYSMGHRRGLDGDRANCPNIKDICSICKSHEHTVKNCPYVATKLILKPREDVVYEDTTLSAAALQNHDTGASACQALHPLRPLNEVIHHCPSQRIL